MIVEVSSFRTERDHASVVQLYREVFPDDPPHNDPERIIENKLKRDAELFLVARRGDLLLGAVMGGYDGVRGWIHHLATDVHHRRQGVARLLIEELEKRLGLLGCVKINLQVRDTNTPVIEFYEKMGYAVEPRASLGKKL